MDQSLDIASLQPLLNSAKSALVLLPQNPSLDKTASALALYLALKKSAKTTTIACPQPMTVEFSQLIGADKITNKIGNRDLVISFDYVKDSIEKVSYNIEGDKFNLVIQPKPNFPPLDPKNVTYSSSGIDSELIFVIGAQRLEDLGSLYDKAKGFDGEKQLVNIDYQPDNSQFGKINLVPSQAASYSEIMAAILKKLNLPLDEEIANNLFLGLKAATKDFQSPQASADTFEAAAWCLRAGAKTSGVSQPVLEKREEKAGPPSPSPDWLSPKIYKGRTQV